MENIIDDIVCDLLDNESIVDPTQAIENLTSLRDVFETYGEQPELVRLTGLTKDAVNEYLDKADASMEGFFTKIKENILKRIKEVKEDKARKYLQVLASLRPKLKSDVIYNAICIGDDWESCLRFIKNIPISPSISSAQEFKRKLFDYRRECKPTKCTFTAGDFRKIERVFQEFDAFIKKTYSDWEKKIQIFENTYTKDSGEEEVRKSTVNSLVTNYKTVCDELKWYKTWFLKMFNFIHRSITTGGKSQHDD